MPRSALIIVLVALTLLTAACLPRHADPISEKELVRRTQELYDAAAPGDRKPWEKYFADDSIYVDEKGRAMDKHALVASQTPLPQGYSGSIKVMNPGSRIFDDTAILSYDLDESETVFGQKLTARYHGTDTWVRRNSQWQIVAGQMLRYYEDPAAGRVDLSKLPEYAGVYELAPGKATVITVEGGRVFLQKPGKPKEMLMPEATDIYFRKGVEGRVVFRRDERGRVDALLDRRNNEDVAWMKRRDGSEK